MDGKSPTTVKVSRRFDASAERVFDAWLDPEKAAKFLFATPGGQMIKAEIDPRVGGRFLFIDRRPEGDAGHHGQYVEIDRPRRLVFTFWVDMFPDGITQVAIDIVPLATGCELTLTHEGVWQEYAERTEGGWTMILDGLARELGRAT
jgi:uncharacterized protein YndB with AHSA1/START domain